MCGNLFFSWFSKNNYSFRVTVVIYPKSLMFNNLLCRQQKVFLNFNQVQYKSSYFDFASLLRLFTNCFTSPPRRMGSAKDLPYHPSSPIGRVHKELLNADGKTVYYNSLTQHRVGFKAKVEYLGEGRGSTINSLNSVKEELSTTIE